MRWSGTAEDVCFRFSFRVRDGVFFFESSLQITTIRVRERTISIFSFHQIIAAHDYIHPSFSPDLHLLLTKHHPSFFLDNLFTFHGISTQHILHIANMSPNSGSPFSKTASMLPTLHPSSFPTASTHPTSLTSLQESHMSNHLGGEKVVVSRVTLAMVIL